jgi:hypothetical protein
VNSASFGSLIGGSIPRYLPYLRLPVPASRVWFHDLGAHRAGRMVQVLEKLSVADGDRVRPEHIATALTAERLVYDDGATPHASSVEISSRAREGAD